MQADLFHSNGLGSESKERKHVSTEDVKIALYKSQDARDINIGESFLRGWACNVLLLLSGAF